MIRRRRSADAGLLLGVGVAILIATITVSGAPAYTRSLEQVGVEGVLTSLRPIGKNLVVTNRAIPSRISSVNAATSDIDSIARTTMADVVSNSRHAHRSAYHRNLDPTTIDDWSLARFVLMDDFEYHVRFVSGDLPRSSLNNVSSPTMGVVAEAAIVADVAEKLGISAGDILTLRLVSGSSSAVDIAISGIFVPDDELGDFWMGLGGSLLRPPLLPGFGGGAAGLFVTSEGFGAVALEAPATPMDGAWILDLDQIGLTRLSAGEIVEKTEHFESRIEANIPGSLVITGLERSFGALERRSVFARIPMFLMSAILLTIVIYYLLMAAHALAGRRKAEISVFRSRGISLIQMLRLYMLEATILVGIPVVFGPFISVAIIAQAGRIPPFNDITEGGTLPVSLSWDQFLFSGVVGLLACALLVLPTVLAGVGNVVTQLRDEARPTRSPFFQRYFLDAVLIFVTSFLIWELTASGNEVIRIDENGELRTDPTLFLAPSFALLGISLVFLRAFPPVLRGLAFVIGRNGPVWAVLAIWRLGRAPYFYAPAVLLLMLASGLGVVIVTLASTLEENALERVLYESGSDLRVESARGANGIVEDLRQLTSVRDASAAMRLQGSIGSGASGPEFELLGVQSDRFKEIAWFRDDFSDRSFTEIMEDISSGETLEPLMVTPGATELGIWAQSGDDINNLFLWATVRGGSGIVETITLGPVEGGDSRLQRVSLEGIVRPIELLSIKVFEPAGDDRGSAGSLEIDDVVSINSATGVRTVMVDFESPDRWTTFPTSGGLDATFSLVQEKGFVGEVTGSKSGRLTFGRGSDGGVRGIYRSTSGGPLPIIVSSTLAANAGIVPGIPFIGRIAGSLTPLTAVAVVDFFPTLDPDNDSGFMVIDLDNLSEFLDLKGVTSTSLTDQLFIAVTPGKDEAALAGLDSLITGAARVYVRRDQQNESLVDPLSVAGWRGVGILAGTTTIGIVLLGYLTYLRSYTGRMNTEEAFLRSLGLSRVHYLWAAVIEHLSLGIIGIGLGIVSGLVISDLAVDVSSRSASGEDPLPPFELVTHWGAMFVGYALIGAVAISALALQTTRYSRRSLHDATRLDK